MDTILFCIFAAIVIFNAIIDTITVTKYELNKLNEISSTLCKDHDGVNSVEFVQFLEFEPTIHIQCNDKYVPK